MENSFEYQNGEISYLVTGSGFPVVLIHGFGEDRHIWNAQINFLSRYCQLIVPDLPGSGKSAAPKADWSIEKYAASIQALLNHENIAQCIMLGHSMGGYITLAFVDLFPEMVRAFGLLHSTAFEDSDEKKQNRLKGIEIMEEYGAFHFLRSTTPNLFGKSFKTSFPEKVQGLINQGIHFTKESLENYYKAMRERPDRSHVLQTSKVPVLFIMGEEDAAVPVNDVLQQVYLPEISYIHILKRVGHMGMWEAEKQFNNYMLRFIEEAGNISE